MLFEPTRNTTSAFDLVEEVLLKINETVAVSTGLKQRLAGMRHLRHHYHNRRALWIGQIQFLFHALTFLERVFAVLAVVRLVPPRSMVKGNEMLPGRTETNFSHEAAHR